jgi:hypothetical protein
MLHRFGLERDVPVAPQQADLLPGSWRRWQQAFDAYDSGDEAETSRKSGCGYASAWCRSWARRPATNWCPQACNGRRNADSKGWTDLLANYLAGGEFAARLRSYPKKLVVETWEYVNWLTHAKNAVRVDAEVGLKAVEHLLGVFTAARLWLSWTSTRCPTCGP